ncbi:hypothetical protein HG530_011626 [Fusarium avenaceum]|nr:hypothetical protein DER45DRAFT_619449 [Fusarium avenaceum]KAI6757028.1 hypothetical protein HG530_011626 [Fusarium avenaceum]KIL86363.1 hypothetical protein FAVG1_10192 [Fusarium avenaceum]
MLFAQLAIAALSLPATLASAIPTSISLTRHMITAKDEAIPATEADPEWVEKLRDHPTADLPKLNLIEGNEPNIIPTSPEEDLFATTSRNEPGLVLDKLEKRIPVRFWSDVPVNTCWNIDYLSQAEKEAYWTDVRTLIDLLRANGRANWDLAPQTYREYPMTNLLLTVRNQSRCWQRGAFSDDMAMIVEAIYRHCTGMGAGWTAYTYRNSLNDRTTTVDDFILIIRPRRATLSGYTPSCI